MAPPDRPELARILHDVGVPCELELPSGEVLGFGSGPAAFRLIVRDERVLREQTSELSLARAYLNGGVDADGDLMTLLRIRDHLPFGTPVTHYLSLAMQLMVKPPRWVSSRVVRRHYGFGDDFYLTFLDTRYRFYSHSLFHSEDETLEQAAEHKLETMWNALALEPGMRLLDIGGGWGGVVEYCGARGVHVTSLTLAEDSARYIRNLIDEQDLQADVLVEDLLDHRPAEPYDHAVIYGVIEHIPSYRRFCTRVWDALKPGGRLYLDASATKEKYAASPVTRRYTWGGAHACLALQDMVGELLFHGFEIVEVKRETRDYELTARHWAQRFDAAREAVIARWGEQLYRTFRLYLWATAHAFQTNRLQAYHLVAERRGDSGPRPGNWRRFGHYLLSLR